VNTPLDHEPEDLRYAEYVLGVLDTDARAAVEREIASDPLAAAKVARWQQHLLPLAEDIPATAPPAHAWARIESALGMQTTRRESTQSARTGWWSNLALWRGFAFGAVAVAAACIIALVVLPRAMVTPAPGAAYMASTITQTDGQVGWTATMDLQHARMVVVPAKPQTLPADRVPELWLIPAGKKPIAVGMIAANGATAIALDKALVAQLGPTAALAVSVEPPGGSPTGQPTGPVIAKGAIGAAAVHGAG
jgi:anti-sigma-K factor RskA